MNLAEQISHHAQALPTPMQQELWAFVQFLEFRLQQQTLKAANTNEEFSSLSDSEQLRPMPVGAGQYSSEHSNISKQANSLLFREKIADILKRQNS